MSAISPEPSALVRRPAWIDVRELWVSVAIVAIWLAVAIAAIFGPDIRSFTVSGNNTVVPSAVVVALFALLATWPVAKYGFGTKNGDG